MRIVSTIALHLLLLSIVSCSVVGPREADEPNFLQKSCADITEIALKSVEKNETNFIFSPFGYSVILGILSEGADGSTKQELNKILHYPEDVNLIRQTYKSTLQRLQDKSGSNPEFKNYFYVYKNFTVQEDYKKILLENYFTDVKSVERPTYDDTETPTDAPEVVTTETSTLEPQKANITHERIKRLAKRFLGIDLDNTSKSELSGLSANRLYSGDLTKNLSRMIVFNGLYFRGLWKTPFQYKLGDESFYKSNGEKISSKMMFTVGQFNVGQLPELDSVVLSIPYKGERYSFVVVLPNRKDGLPEVLKNFNKVNLKEISKMEQRHVQISIPSFEFKTISYLREHLNNLGAHEIFTSHANFNSISKDSGLFVDDVVQLVTINIDNDAGTPNFLTVVLGGMQIQNELQYTSSTTIIHRIAHINRSIFIFTASSVQTRTVTEKFTADHPFLFFVQDHKDNLIIAAGALYEPMKDSE